jgi:hypothetical protein
MFRLNVAPLLLGLLGTAVLAVPSWCLEAKIETATDKSLRQLTLADLKTFNDDDRSVSETARNDITSRVIAETGLEKPRPMPDREKKRIAKAFEQGLAANYDVQQLVDAGVFKFRPIVNLHPNSLKNVDDKSVRRRDGKELEIDNSVWGKKNLPAVAQYGVMHSTEDGAAGASRTIDMWNNDASAGQRSSSTPFVVGRSLDGPEIYVTADFETRWQRHCSSKLTARPGLVNWTSVGVEMEHSTEKDIDYTDAEIRNSACLWTYIQQRAKFPDNKLVTHGELQGYLPKDHVSFRSDPEGFDWSKFGKEMLRLRKKSRFEPPQSPVSDVKTIPQVVLQVCGRKVQ